MPQTKPLAPSPGVAERGYSSVPVPRQPLQIWRQGRWSVVMKLLLSKRLALWCCRYDNKLGIVYYSQTIRSQINRAIEQGEIWLKRTL